MEEQNYRPLTRQEQLEWLIPFLEKEIVQYMAELQLAKEELLAIKMAELENKTVGKSL